MPRSKTSFKKKSKFHGNRYVKVSKPSSVHDEASSSVIDDQQCTPQASTSRYSTPSSSASKKLDFNAYEDFSPNGNGNCIFDLDVLSEAIKGFVCCKNCGSSDCIQLNLLDDKKHGLAVLIELFCNICEEKTVFRNSKLCNSNPKKFDINLKFVYGMRSIGKGYSAGNMLCALMDLPAPPQHFGPYTRILKSTMEICAQNSMIEATKEAVEENNGSKDLVVALDGTWQKRGHKSLNGVVSVTSVDTGKVLDVSVMTKFCHVCTVSANKKVEPDEHICTKNYEGSSGGMEVAGALTIFENSKKRDVRYVKYLGDGDSKGFQEVVKRKPYGDLVSIEKLECIGHVQKRMGSRLRRLKKELRGKKLDDGRVLGGKNRLTNEQIDKLQNYYGLAIRRAVSEKKGIQEMRKNIWATYFHKMSTDDDPHHGLCPKGPDSWCGYNKAQENNSIYKHKDSLPKSCLSAIKNVYRDLSTDDLLSKCLHGQTQNQNESFNNIIWSKVPKTVFVRFETLTLGVHEAVLSFNDGHVAKLKFYRELGLKFSETCISALKKMDILRLDKSMKAASEMTKEARQARRRRRMHLEDQDSDKEEDPDYGAGLF